MGNADSQGLASGDNAVAERPAVVDGKSRRLPDSSAKLYRQPLGATGSDRRGACSELHEQSAHAHQPLQGDTVQSTASAGRAISPNSSHRDKPQSVSSPDGQNGPILAQQPDTDLKHFDSSTAPAIARSDRAAPDAAPTASDATAGWGQQQCGVGTTSLMPPALLSSLSVEAQLRQREQQIQALTKQIEASQSELQQLRIQSAAPTIAAPAILSANVRARAERACQILEGARPEVECAHDKLGKSLKVAKKLNAWFVENAKKMNIQDPTATPSALLQQLLEACEVRSEHMLGHLSRMERGVESAVARVSAAHSVSGLDGQSVAISRAAQSFPPSGGHHTGNLCGSASMQPNAQSSISTSTGLQHAVQPLSGHQAPPSGSVPVSAQVPVPRAVPTQASNGYAAQVRPQPVDSAASTRSGKLPNGMWVRDPEAEQ